MTKQNVLIISYYFPPNASVGSRRWAKYAKVLHQKGVNVHVLCAIPPVNSKSAWDEDVKGLNIHSIQGNYPKILDDWKLTHPLKRLRYKLVTKKVAMTSTGMMYDRALYWKNNMLEKASYIIDKENIDVLIVSTPPHRSSFYALDLKKKFANLELMVDFRDPWMWGAFREYATLKGKDKELEDSMCRQVIEGADTLIVPVENMRRDLNEFFQGNGEKIYFLPSAFDLDDFKKIKKKSEKKGDSIKLIYYGSLYDNLDDHFEQIAKFLKSTKLNVHLNIYSKSKKYQEIFVKQDVASQVSYHEVMPSNLIFKKVIEADFVFLFKPYEYGKDNVSTKYFEIVKSKTPVILIGDKGKASEFIVNNALGVHAEVKEGYNVLTNLFRENSEFKYNAGYDVDQFSFQFLGQKFIDDKL